MINVDWTVSSDDLGIIVLVAVIAVWSIIHKILNGRRQVVRHVLHGTVTYTIKGYNGPEAQRIAKALREKDPEAEVDGVAPYDPHSDVTLTKATAKDVR